MTPLLPDERRQADRLALEIAALVRDTPGATKAPMRRAALARALYLVGEEGMLAAEPAGGNGGEETA